LDAPSFLEKTLLPTKAREELDNLGEDQLGGANHEAIRARLSCKLPYPLQV